MIVERDKLNANITPSTPTRILGTAFQPHPDRPVWVSYTIEMFATSVLLGSADRRVELRSDASNPPTTVRAQTRVQLSGVAATNGQSAPLTYLVPKGHFVNLVGVVSSGAGSTAIVNQVEIPL